MDLEVGEYVCWKCHGNQMIPDRNDVWMLCPFCHGKGKIDWIENIKGKGKLTASVSSEKLFKVLMERAKAEKKIIITAEQGAAYERREQNWERRDRQNPWRDGV